MGQIQGPPDDGDLILAQVPPKPVVYAVDVQHGLQLRPPEQGLQSASGHEFLVGMHVCAAPHALR